MHTTSQIPFKKSATALRVYIKVLLIAFDNQFILAVPVKIGKLVVLPVLNAKAYPVGSILGLDEVMIDGGTHMAHINAAK